MKPSFAFVAILFSVVAIGCGGSDGAGDEPPAASGETSNQVTGETGAAGETEAPEEPATRAELAGRTFSATGAEGVEITKKNPLELTFSEKRLGVDAGCNRIGGNYSLEDGDIQAFLATTLMGCPPKQTELEVFVSELFRGGAVTRLGGDTLVLEGKNATSLTLVD